jgi:hypothetical protein
MTTKFQYRGIPKKEHLFWIPDLIFFTVLFNIIDVFHTSKRIVIHYNMTTKFQHR